ncbi:putative AttC protein [Bradyrhizobium oligotrophicum S58]|uniref:Putative AttC protein n=1 Tax=Bradyrhizobium oligotrophicum S58 TaxID=1245469 RepID=M4Z1C9_9BRAD|nr:ABC transporter substrate-binding protein [Bradyrhizobium oligotrophicum]BAM86933.1 putative AttC protein [Bradyrhizobium oligotrophicum S58]
MKRLLLVATFCGLTAGAAFAEQKEVVVATTGGVFNQAISEIWFEPFTKQTGIKVKTVVATDAQMRSKAQAMFEAKDVAWDMINNVDILAASAQNRAFTEDLTEFCKQFAERRDLANDTCNASGVKITYNATLLAFNADKFKGLPPQTWADFWNVKDFPGPRALPNFGDPWRVLAAALLADGVATDQLFPLDLDRAFKKLDQIKPQVSLWWKTGDQSQQGFRGGDYVMGMIWGTRVSALKAEGQPVQQSYDQAFMLADTMQILKNSPNGEGAQALLKFYLETPAVQAKFAEKFGVTPVSQDAIKLMSDEGRAKIPTSSEAFKKIIKHDPAWINDNQARILEAWNAWMLK